MDFIFGKMDFVGLLTVVFGDRKISHYRYLVVYTKKCNKWVALFCVL